MLLFDISNYWKMHFFLSKNSLKSYGLVTFKETDLTSFCIGTS